MYQYRGQTALVTGASSGIGQAFAEELAARGSSLVLVARSKDVLDQAAAELSAKHNVTVDVVPADLSQVDAVEKIAARVAELGRTIDLLVNNAGVMTYGSFETIDPAREAQMLQINVASLVALTHVYLPGMLDRRRGGVINVSSTASFQPTPYLATYAATKAFVSSFTVALSVECQSRNVTVTSICPGMTSTKLFDDNGMPVEQMGAFRTPKQVVATALTGFEKRHAEVVDGWKNFFLGLSSQFAPRRISAGIAAMMVGPKTSRAKSS